MTDRDLAIASEARRRTSLGHRPHERVACRQCRRLLGDDSDQDEPSLGGHRGRRAPGAGDGSLASYAPRAPPPQEHSDVTWSSVSCRAVGNVAPRLVSPGYPSTAGCRRPRRSHLGSGREHPRFPPQESALPIGWQRADAALCNRLFWQSTHGRRLGRSVCGSPVHTRLALRDQSWSDNH
jgi:hypothetical protein